MMSGGESAELLTFRALLRSISIDAASINGLSKLMRDSNNDVTIRQKILQIWLSDVQNSSDPIRLLALVYLANDVIQLLGGKEQNLLYRYHFAVPLAQAIVVVRQRAPSLIPKIDRILNIFQDRVIYDTQVLRQLQRVLKEDNMEVVMNSIIPTIQTETSTRQKLNERLQQLERESHEKHNNNGTPLPTTTANQQQHSTTTTQHQQRHPQPQNHQQLQRSRQQPPQQPRPSTALAPRFIPPPPLDDLIHAGRNIEKLCCAPRRQECVNLDAEIVSRFRGHRVLPNARIGTTDRALIECYKALLNDHKERAADIKEKIARRKKEEEKGQFLLMVNRASQPIAANAAKRIEVLMKKELNARYQKVQVEHAIYWKLVETLDFLQARWKRIQSIVESVETETQRRNEVVEEAEEEE